MSEEHQDYHPPRRRGLSTPVAIIIAGALVAIGLYAGLSSQKSAAPGAPGEAPKVNVKDVKVDSGTPYIGKKNAPVTIAYWFDYQCPFCKAVDVGHDQIKIKPALPEVIKDYVETGKVRILYKDYPFLSEDSTTAALYMHAVWEKYPEKFYEWHKAMMVAQDEEHGGFGNEESIVALSSTIPGIDGAALKALVAKNKDKYTKAMEAARAEATAMGISGTPGLLTGKTLLPGAVPPEQLKAAIDAQLK